MEYPKYKEISRELDEFRSENNKPKAMVVKKILIYITICFLLAFVQAYVEVKKDEFRKTQ